MDRDSIYELLQEAEIPITTIEWITCPGCGGKSEVVVNQFEQLQIRDCRHGHTAYYNATGSHLWFIENKDDPDYLDWRVAFDRKREADYNPNGQAWDDAYKRRRQRRKSDGHFNYYSHDPANDEDGG